MALSFLYRLVRRVVELLGILRMDNAAKAAEILVLRHQLAVLERQFGRPHFTWSDRAVMATLAKLVSREGWAAFLVTPETIPAGIAPSFDGAGPTRNDGQDVRPT